MAGERSTLRPKAGNADEFSRTGDFKLRGLGSLRGSDMGMYSESMTQSGVLGLGGRRLPRLGGEDYDALLPLVMIAALLIAQPHTSHNARRS
jgi:hypothetical protein